MAGASKKKWAAASGKVGRNASYAISEAGVMTITVDLNIDLGKSSSGKSDIIATSEGNQRVDGGEGAIIGLNIYKKAA